MADLDYGLGLDLNFFRRVHRTSLVLTVLTGALIWEMFRMPAAVGWVTGSALSLLMLAGVEWTVLRFVRPGNRSTRGLLGMLLLKLVGAATVLGLAFVGALNGWLSLLWLLGGFALPHSVIFLKLIGQKLRELSVPEESARS